MRSLLLFLTLCAAAGVPADATEPAPAGPSMAITGRLRGGAAVAGVASVESIGWFCIKLTHLDWV